MLKNYEINHINIRRKLKKYQVCHYSKLNDSPETNVYSNTIFMLKNTRGSVGQSVLQTFTEGRTGFEYHKQVSFGGKKNARRYNKPTELVISEEEDEDPKIK
jgi:hypothetical protein